MFATITEQLRLGKMSLDLPPDQVDTANLAPIFVPASFFALGNWPGPYARLRAPQIGLTWTVLFPGQGMRYADFGMARHWETGQLDWKDLAMRNLSRLTVNQPGLREMRRANGELSALVFMFGDGLGPSRLLFRRTLREKFPQGYRVAIPEMSCGFAFAKDLDGEDLAGLMETVDHCYQEGTRPLAAGAYDADDLLPVEEVSCGRAPA